MDDIKAGNLIRAIRMKARKTQAQVAELAAVRVSDVSQLERGMLDDLSVGVLRRIGRALDVWLELLPRWQRVELDRLTNAAHGALQAAVVRFVEGLPGWEAIPEVTFSIFGERGAIDILAWHASTRTLLIIELKTLLVEAAELTRKMHQRQRLAPQIAADRDWAPETVATWVIFTDTRSNRRDVDANKLVLQKLAAIDGRAMRSWLRSPNRPVAALSFCTEPKAVIQRRMRRTRAEIEAAAAAKASRGAVPTAARRAAAVGRAAARKPRVKTAA